MKIGILTFHRANNLGAVLQASALQKFIQDNCGNCVIIDYYPNNSIPVVRGKIRKIIKLVKRLLMYPMVKKKNERECRFDEYRNKFYVLTEHHYYGDEGINDELQKFDVLVSGSDQILNTTLTGCSRAYYLNFFYGKKISYASSFGRTSITEDEKRLIKNNLSKFDAISVREKSAGKIIYDLIGINSELVVDPVFLLSKDEWENRCNMNMKLPKRYIFVYSMEHTKLLENMVNEVKKQKNIPIIVVSGGGKAYGLGGEEDLTCGPEEFLRYIRDAELVITNSFHGTAFSIIFEKQFVCVSHSTRNSRLENIMELICEQDKFIKEGDNIPKIVDGKKATIAIHPYIVSSKEYLRIALKAQ